MAGGAEEEHGEQPRSRAERGDAAAGADTGGEGAGTSGEGGSGEGGSADGGSESACELEDELRQLTLDDFRAAMVVVPPSGRRFGASPALAPVADDCYDADLYD